MRFGIDLGGTKIEILALGERGEERLRRRISTPRDKYEDVVRAIRDLVEGAEAELRESTHDTFRILGGRPDEQIKVASVTRETVVGDGERANDEVFNSVRVQQLDKLAPIFGQRHLGDGGRGAR